MSRTRKKGAKTKRPGNSRAVVRRLAILALLGCGGAFMASFLGRLHWFLDLFSHFQLQYCAVLLAVAIILAALRSWKLLAATGMLLVPSAFQASYYLPVASPSGIPAAFQVTTHNIMTSNTSHREVLDYHRRSDADIMLLMEVDQAWADTLHPLVNSHPHRVILPREDNFGMALYSTFPITGHHTETLPPGIPVLSATIATHQGPVHVLGVHPIPPMGATSHRDRNAYLDRVAELAGQTGHPTIVLGDFNTSPWAPSFRDLVKATGLRDSGKHRGLQTTWQRRNPLKSIPIDHILHTPDLQVFERRVGPALGSDHNPVHVTFSVGGG